MSITTVDDIDIKNIPNIKFFNFYCKKNKIKKYPIDISYINQLCTEGKLKDAKIFKYLFGLKIPNNIFKLDDNYYYDFSEYNITFEDWSVFIKFIKYNILSDEDIDKLILICNKFGGIPCVDRYLNNKNKLLHIPKEYNPQLPDKDYLNLYHWKTCIDKDLIEFQNKHINYSACGFIKINAVTFIHYFRKKYNKNNINKNYIYKNRINNNKNSSFYDDMYDFRKDILK